MYSGKNYFIAFEYETNLDQLRVSNIKDDFHRLEMISNLTLMAHNELSNCEIIVNVIRNNWQVFCSSSRVLIVNLIHSIITSVGGKYTNLFDQHIVDIFVATYERAETMARNQLINWRGRWEHHFSTENLRRLDEAVKVIDPSWPAFTPKSAKFLKKYEKFAFSEDVLRLKKERDSLMAELKQTKRKRYSNDENPQKKQKMSELAKAVSKPEHKQMLPEIEQKEPTGERKLESKDKKLFAEPKLKTESKLRAQPKKKSILEKLRSKYASQTKWSNQFKSKPKAHILSEVKKTNPIKLELNKSMDPKKVFDSSKIASIIEKSIGPKKYRSLKLIAPLPERKSTGSRIEKPSRGKKSSPELNEKYLELFGSDDSSDEESGELKKQLGTLGTNTSLSEKETATCSFEKPQPNGFPIWCQKFVKSLSDSSDSDD